MAEDENDVDEEEGGEEEKEVLLSEETKARLRQSLDYQKDALRKKIKNRRSRDDDDDEIIEKLHKTQSKQQQQQQQRQLVQKRWRELEQELCTLEDFLEKLRLWNEASGDLFEFQDRDWGGVRLVDRRAGNRIRTFSVDFSVKTTYEAKWDWFNAVAIAEAR